MKRKAPSLAVILMALTIVTVLVNPAAACTEFSLKAQDGGFVIGRGLPGDWTSQLSTP